LRDRATTVRDYMSKSIFAAFIPADIAVSDFLYRPNGESPDAAQPRLSSILSSVTGHPASPNERSNMDPVNRKAQVT
jgi:hypothetical protein